MPDALRSAWNIGQNSALYLSLAATNTKPGPRQPPKEPKKEEDEKPKTVITKPAPKPKTPPAPKEPPKPKEEPDLTPVDLTVELTDTAGHVARLPLSQFGVARHPLDARIYRRAGRDAARFTNIYELIPADLRDAPGGFRQVGAGFRPPAARNRSGSCSTAPRPARSCSSTSACRPR